MTSGATDTQISIGPPEILFDMPLSMGCYQTSPSSENINTLFSSTSGDMTPAKCIVTCLAENNDYRYAGTM